MLEGIVRRTLVGALLSALGCSVSVPSKCTFGSEKLMPACLQYNLSLGYDASPNNKDALTNKSLDAMGLDDQEDILFKEMQQKGKECTDLKNYPFIFVTNGEFNGYFVIGEKASALDNLTMTNLAASMQYVDETGNLVPVKVKKNSIKLDGEIVDVSAQNLISIGNPCVNSVSAELLGNPVNCSEGFVPGKARVKLFLSSKGYCAMLVAGYNADDTGLAGKVIAQRWKELSGLEVEIEGTTYNNATITTPQAVSRKKEYTINAKKWAFIPNKITTSKGDYLSFIVKPQDFAFTFAIKGYSIEQNIKGPTTINLIAEKSGSFQYTCSSCEEWRGMVGTLVVE